MAVAGPNVGTSATGEALAIGPPGPPGPQGDDGPEGAAGNITGGDVVVVAGYATVASLGKKNTVTHGSVPAIDVWGAVLHLLPSSSQGVTAPAIDGSFDQTNLWTDRAQDGGVTTGTFLKDTTGLTTCLAQSVWFGNIGDNAVNTQMLFCGGGGIDSSITVGLAYADTLTGASQDSHLGFPCPAGVSGNSAVHAKFIMQARVVSSSGGTETAGDIIRVTAEVDIQVIGGVATALLATTPTTKAKGAVDGDGATIWSVTLSLSLIAGNLDIDVGTPGSFDASTVLDFTVFCTDMQVT